MPARGIGTLTLIATLGLAGVASAVPIEWVTIGDPGNAADTTGFGAVSHTYRISKYEITNAQYVEFLNAKAASDPLGLYEANMAAGFGGIAQSGSSGSFSYATIAGREDKPVNYVSFYDALRFANWLHNGQGSGDTETGAYTLLGGGPTPTNGATITREGSATVFLTSEDEWYKAAYYDALSSSYTSDPFADAAGGTCAAAPGTTSHAANCFFAVGNLTDAGAYSTAVSAGGTFDQGGNVREWNESLIGSNRGQRGGSWRDAATSLAAASATSSFPTVESDFVGFRLASLVPVPEPGTAALLAFGLAGLGRARPRRRAPLD